MTTPDVAGPSPQSYEDEGHELHDDTLPTRPLWSIAATSPHWQTTLESLLRFPGLDPKLKLFRPGNPVEAIASALGATDSAHTIIENDWVAIARRVFEIQTCCMMNAKQLDFAIDADGWVTWSPTADWCAHVLQKL